MFARTRQHYARHYRLALDAPAGLMAAVFIYAVAVMANVEAAGGIAWTWIRSVAAIASAIAG